MACFTEASKPELTDTYSEVYKEVSLFVVLWSIYAQPITALRYNRQQNAAWSRPFSRQLMLFGHTLIEPLYHDECSKCVREKVTNHRLPDRSDPGDSTHLTIGRRNQFLTKVELLELDFWSTLMECSRWVGNKIVHRARKQSNKVSRRCLSVSIAYDHHVSHIVSDASVSE